jgi:hypothetical protein
MNGYRSLIRAERATNAYITALFPSRMLHYIFMYLCTLDMSTHARRHRQLPVKHVLGLYQSRYPTPHDIQSAALA